MPWLILRAARGIKVAVRKDWPDEAKTCRSLTDIILGGPAGGGLVMVLDGNKRYRHALKCPQCMLASVSIIMIMWPADVKCALYDESMFELEQ